jgi:PKD repeat protein
VKKRNALFLICAFGFLLLFVLNSRFMLPPYANPDVLPYYPSGYSLLGSTTYVSGTTSDLQSDNSVYMTFRSYPSAPSGQTLYSHQENTTIGAATYYWLNLTSAEASGLSLNVSTASTGRKLWGSLVYSLKGVYSIPASAWTVYYRAWMSSSGLTCHAEVDILVRQSNGSTRTTINTAVAESASLNTTQQTVSATYSWTAYSVVDQTDYLEIDFYCHVTAALASETAYLRLDDNTLAVADQTHVSNVMLPSQYTLELEFLGSSNTKNWYQLVWTLDSSLTTGSATVTLQLYNYATSQYPVSGDGYISYTSSATANTDETKNQTITTNPTEFRDASGNWKIKVKAVKTTSTQFDFKGDLVRIEAHVDTNPPVWSNTGANNTKPGQPTLFYAKWTDDFGLSGFIFGTNNSGMWVNDTWIPMSGASNWSNVTKILNVTATLVQWGVWANDTTDNWNYTGTLSLVLSQYPVASFTYSPLTPRTGETVTFDASGSHDPDGTIASYFWTFGDEANGTGMIATHSYAENGTYAITLTATDNDGLTNTTMQNMTVFNQPPNASFTTSATSAPTGTIIHFNASASYDPDGAIVSYFWAFGDGNNGTGVTIDHAYAENGTYVVTLTVTDNDGATGTANATEAISNRPPIASFTESATIVYTGEVIYFDASASSDPDGTVFSYFWNFGDGTNATGVTASHGYADNGTYTVTLTVTDNDGATGTATAVKTVLNRPPVAIITESATTVYTGELINFNASNSYDPDGFIANYSWNFGDGYDAIGPIVSHSYAENGNYAVTLTVMDSDGATGSSIATIIVLNRAPNALFTYTPSFPIVGETATLNASQSSDPDGTITNYTWNFGDGNITATANPIITHSYALEGNHTVTLTVTDNDGATANTTQVIKVRNYPLADFTYEPATPCKDQTVTFNATASNPRGGAIGSYFWSFGDNSTLNTTDPIATKVYTAAGDYNVNLTVTDTEGLSNATSKTVTIISGPPVAIFTYKPAYPAVGQTITFNASDSYDPNGNVVSYVWSFGDGNVTSIMNPIIYHSYIAIGNYTVRLTVTDNDGLTNTTSKLTTIGNPPQANFDYSPERPYMGDLVTFNASQSTAGNKTIVSYTWNFGDGSPIVNKTDPITTHTYQTAGNLTVTLTITDDSGLTSTITKTITVQQAPVAVFTYSPTYPQTYVTITFNASQSYDPNGHIVSYVWDFGDGNVTTVVAPTITHFYTAFGNYTTVLIVSDNSGYADSSSKVITILPHPPTADFTYLPVSPIVGETVTFNASGSHDLDGTIISYSWSFGDGNTTTTSNPIITHAYTSHGGYTITLTVTDNDNLTGNKTSSVAIRNYPTASFTITPSIPDVNNTATFDASSSTPNGGVILYYLWNFGDSAQLNTTNPITTHVYASTGNYTATLTVTDSEGLTINTSRIVQVVAKPKAIFTYSPSSPYVGDTVTLNASNSYDPDGAVVSYLWDFGDGSPILNTTNPITTHIYSMGGNRPVVLTVVDNMGYSNATFSLISVNKAPVAYFTNSPVSPIVGQTVTFDASGSSDVRRSIANYTWNFGDGNTTTTTSTIIIHAHTIEGSYDVKLTVVDTGGYNDTYIKTITVRNYPIAYFVLLPSSPIKNETTTFDASSTNPRGGTITLYLWDFGDGAQLNTTNPITTHTYLTIGQYGVTLTVIDSEGLSGAIFRTINVRDYPTPDFTWSPTSPFAKEKVTFDASASVANSGNIATYVWNWGDGTSTFTTSEPIAEHIYSRGQIYSVTLTVTNSENLSSPISKYIAVQKLAPNASFVYAPDIIIVNTLVTFDGHDSRDLDGWITNYAWNFGDGNATSSRTWMTNHTYAVIGNYTVTLTVTDNDGLTGSMMKVLKVIVYPTADFAWTPTSPQSSKPMTFDGSMSTANVGVIINYTWNFGDENTTSTTDAVIVHAFGVYGIYTVTLTVTNSEGLSASKMQNVTIAGCAPDADFSWQPPYPIINQDILFDASSTNPNGGSIAVYEWNFGDGGPPEYVFFEPTITHRYSMNGEYNVTLRVTDNEKMNATTLKIVVVGRVPTPPTANFTWSPTSPYLGQTVTFNASLSTPNGGEITSYEWNFGDSNTTSTTNPIIHHVYAVTGNYTVVLNVTDNEGLWSVEQKAISILPLTGPTASFTCTPYYPHPNDTATLDASESTPGWNGTHAPQIVEYRWDFGDGNTTITIYPMTTHMFGKEGNFTVTLTVVDINGASDTVTQIVRVYVHTPFPWDVTGDGYVGIDDIYAVATHFGLSAGDPGWNPIYDITGDGYIGVDDIFEVAMHFAQEAP